jgi:hypothetical protein
MARPIVLRWLIIGFLVGVLVAGIASWFLRPAAVPSPEAQAVLEEWLANTCARRHQSQLESALSKFGDQLEEPLIGLFESGPAASEIQRVEDSARREFEHTRALVRSGFPSGLPPSDKDALLMASVDEWVKRAGKDFVSSQKSDALVGLSTIGRRKGRRLLEQVAANANSEYQDVARQVLDGDSPPAKNSR